MVLRKGGDSSAPQRAVATQATSNLGLNVAPRSSARHFSSQYYVRISHNRNPISCVLPFVGFTRWNLHPGDEFQNGKMARNTKLRTVSNRNCKELKTHVTH